MNKSMKILVSIISIIIIFCISTVVLISTKIKPELIKKEAISAINKNLPNATASIESIDYSIGTSVTLELEKFLLVEKATKNKLLSLNNLKVKIPIWAILTSGGTIDIITDNPDIFVNKKNGELNWSKALSTPNKKIVSENSDKKKVDKKEIEVPSFINKSKINFKLTNLNLFLDLGEEQKSKVNISVVKVRNISLEKSTAFEVKTEIKHQLEKEKFFKTKVKLVGEFDLGELLKKEKLKTQLNISINETKIDGLEFNIPNIKGKINLSGSVEKPIVDKSLVVQDVLNLKAKTKINDSKVSVEDLNIALSLEELVNKVPAETKKQLQDFNLSGVKIVTKGKVDLDLDKNELNPNIKIVTSKPIGMNAIDGIPVNIRFSGIVNGQKIEMILNNDLLNGITAARIDTKLDLMNPELDVKKMNPINIAISLSNLKIAKSLIQDKLWSSSNKTTAVSQDEQQAVTKEGSKIYLPKTNISINGKHIWIDKEEISLNGNISMNGTNIKSKNMIMKYGKGQFIPEFTANIKDSNTIDTKFQLGLKNVEVSAFNAFFPPFINDIRGNFKGIVKGSFLKATKPKFNVNVGVQGVNGEIKQLSLKKMFKSLIDKYAKGKADSLKDVDSKFDNITIKLNATEKEVKLKTFTMNGHKKKSKITASGNVSLEDKNSKIKGILFVEALRAELMKNADRKDMPYQLKGKGFGLLPDVGYTTEKLVSAVAKKQVKKESKKIEKKIKKEAEKKLKKLFKGFKL